MTETFASDVEGGKEMRIKTAAMGGSYFDSACRMICTVVALTAFCFFAFHQNTVFRQENGLKECYTLDTVEQPIPEETA